jgi:ribose transport system ATP-binding protein
MSSPSPDATSRVGEPANLIVRGLSKTFSGVTVLNAVDFEAGYGEVHGLLGQNGSGKSTLIKILGGVHAPDPGGRVELGGTEVPLPMPPGNFNRFGIAIVHQALGLVPSLSVTENLLVRRLVRDANGCINWRRAQQEAAALFAQYDVAIDPLAIVQSLPPVDRALLAIVRAFHEIDEAAPTRGGLLILDEPTPFLSHREVDKLFELVRKATRRGTSVLFVSHDIDEVMALTDRATVLRNGSVAGTLDTSQASKQDFITAIVGRHLQGGAQVPRQFTGTPAVTLSGLVGAGVGGFDLNLHRGEIVGLTGLVGSGYDRIPYMVYGATRASAGTLTLDQRTIDIGTTTPERSIDCGLILVPADRQGSAVAEGLSIGENLAIPMFGRALSDWLVTAPAIDRLARGLIERFDVRPPDQTALVRSLSGGNQQKVVLAKWFQCNPRLILLDEPTQGVDVGAREQVYEIIRQASEAGACVICASSDHEQLASICDRVLVFNRGAVIAELTGDDVNKNTISTRCYGSDNETSRGMVNHVGS